MTDQSPLFDLDTFFVKEHVGMLKLHDEFDILDPDSGRKVGHAYEAISGFKKFMRAIISKKLMSADIVIQDRTGEVVARMRRGAFLFSARCDVTDGQGRPLGYFKSKVISLGGGFHVYDHRDERVAEIKGDWKGWNFRFLGDDGVELGKITKKWAGIGKELFTSADNYAVTIDPQYADSFVLRQLLLCASIAIDSVFKEKQ